MLLLVLDWTEAVWCCEVDRLQLLRRTRSRIMLPHPHFIAVLDVPHIPLRLPGRPHFGHPAGHPTSLYGR